jgi:hypothetical protein
MPTRTRVSALMLTLTLAPGLAGCGAAADRATAAGKAATPASSASPSTASPSTASPSTASTSTAPSPTASLARRAPGPSTPSVPKQRFVCPLGGIEEAIELQRAVDNGHQPWRTSPTDVATACTFPGGVVKALGANTYRVTKVSTGQTVIVKEVQPVRPGPTGIWVVTKVTPN